MYIKIDENGDPIEYPLIWDNVAQLIGTPAFTDDDLKEHNLALILNYIQPDICKPDTKYSRSDIVKNENGDIEQIWNITKKTVAEKVREWVLGPRETRLMTSDWTQGKDAPLTPEQVEEWAVYRRQLRDITDTYDFETIESAADIEWPIPPSTESKVSKWGEVPPGIVAPSDTPVPE
jgi:hypothetical protein